jgi:U3 small nucleolar RNA-associated protein 13
VLGVHRLDASFVASGSQDLTIKLWSLSELDTKVKGEVRLKARVTEKAHDKTVNSISVSPNDKLLATGSQDKTAKVCLLTLSATLTLTLALPQP